MKIIQLIVGPQTQTWQGNLIGLGDDGKVYVEQPRYDDDDNLLSGRIWSEVLIYPPMTPLNNQGEIQ